MTLIQVLDAVKDSGLAVATLAMWLAVVFLGRLIAYDHVWGALSPSIRQ